MNNPDIRGYIGLLNSLVRIFKSRFYFNHARFFFISLKKQWSCMIQGLLITHLIIFLKQNDPFFGF